MKKREIRKKMLLAKNRTARRSCWVKKGRTNAWWENFITNKATESEWKDNFRMSRKSFYVSCDMSEFLEHPFPELSEEYSMLSRHLYAQNQ